MKNKLLSGLLAIAMLFSMIPTTVLATGEITTSGGTNEVPAVVNQDATTFSVTVPTSLPVYVDGDGVVTVATDNKIINNSYGPVEVKSVEVQPKNNWSLVDFSTDFTSKKVGLKEFGFQINDADVQLDGTCEAEFAVIAGNGSLSFTYNAVVARQKVALSDVQIASVVFTVGWADSNAEDVITGYEITPVTELDVYDDGSLILDNGESADLSAVATYSLETPTWYSSNESVLTVSEDGVMTAVAPGYAEITYGTSRVNETIGVWVPGTIEITSSDYSLIGYTEGDTNLIIPKYVMYTDSQLKKITGIATNAFNNQTGVTYIELPESITDIGEGAFDGCPNIEDVYYRGTDEQWENINIGESNNDLINGTDYGVALTSISLNKTSTSLSIGESETLTVSYNPSNTTENKTVIWTSSDESVATVNNGTITANNWGTTIITANVNGKTASCEVTVPQILTGVSLNQTAITIENGDTYQLEATSSYRTVYNWSSSNTSVATVDSNGLVTAVGPGSAVISVAQGEYGATCAVIVTQKLTGISLSSSSLTLNEGASSTLTVSYSPSNTTDNKTVTWISSDTSVATVSNGKVTAVKAGSTTITATVGSYSKTCTVTVKAPLTGISLNKTSTTLNIGGTETLTVTYTPSNTTDSKTVTWTSSNTSVATVSNGKITAVGAGTATITATVGSYSKTCTVTVNKISISSVPSQSGTLTYTGSAQSPTWNNYDSSKLTIGGTTSSTNAGTYTATFTPKSGYQWSDGTTTAKSVNWTINKATNPLSLSASSGTIWCCAVIDDFGNVEYEGNDSFTVSNPSGGELSITCSDYNAIYTQRFESTVYIYSGTYSEAKTYSVTVTSAETTNYKAGSATYLVRIQYSGAC